MPFCGRKSTLLSAITSSTRATGWTVSNGSEWQTAAAVGRVSVVIPVWGSYVGFASEAVASANGETLVQRVVVVDNANDPPLATLDGCEVVRSDRRLTRGAIRNFGLEHIDTEFVVFLDADDLLLARSLPTLVAALDRFSDAPAAVGGIVETNGTPYRLPRDVARALARRPRLFAWVNATWSIMPIQGCALLRTASVRDAGGYADADHGEDWALAAALAFRGRVVFTSEPTLVYRFGPDSPAMSRQPRRLLLANSRRIRGRLRQDPVVSAGGAAAYLLAAAQVAAVLVGQPAVRAARRIRGALR
jgi:glycosyltransferase involved in cell wall biosynthesis